MPDGLGIQPAVGGFGRCPQGRAARGQTAGLRPQLLVGSRLGEGGRRVTVPRARGGVPDLAAVRVDDAGRRRRHPVQHAGQCGRQAAVPGQGIEQARGSQQVAGQRTGGGGGGGWNTSWTVGGNGGSGIVIISYANTYPDITTIGAGLTYTKTTPTGYKVYSFTAGTGTVTF